MDKRALEIHASALSPPEYKAFGSYLGTLTNRPSVTPSHIQPDCTFSRAGLKSIGVEKIGCKESQVDEILAAVQPELHRPLSLGQTFAFFRLASHARIAKPDQSGQVRKTDLALVFVPCTPRDPSEAARVPPPVPVRQKKAATSSTLGKAMRGTDTDVQNRDSRPTRSSTSRQSLPARFPSNPFQGTEEEPRDRSTSTVHFEDDTPVQKKPESLYGDLRHPSTNPFRQRFVSGPTVVARPPPPLPPRKVSRSGENTTESPRRGKRASSISSDTSLLSIHTSGTRTSPLIQQSLMAAEHQYSLNKKPESQIQIIRQSSNISPQKPSAPTKRSEPNHKNAELIRRVSTAVKESEQEDQPPAPPRRSTSTSTSTPTSASAPNSTRSKSRMQALAQSILDEDPSVTPWTCVDLIQGIPGPRPYAMIVLNQPITRKDIFLRAWAASELRLCADGGANRLYDLFNDEQRAKFIPTLIKGDLDSLRSDVREYYAAKGVSVMHDGSEYSTDLQKCIEEVESAESSAGVTYDLLLIGGLSGRVDQTVHVMSLLHKLRKTRPHSFILSSESLAWVVDKGKHVIEIDHSTMGQTCGILPVGIDSAFVTTEGLKWNLDWETSFDGDVSSSNHLLPSEPLVRLTTDKPVMWCIEIKPNLPTLPGSGTGSERHGSMKSKSKIHRVDDIPKPIRDLSMGMAKAAEGLGRELEKLQSQSAPARAPRNTKPAQETHLPPTTAEERKSSATSTDQLRHEAGWTRLN